MIGARKWPAISRAVFCLLRFFWRHRFSFFRRLARCRGNLMADRSQERHLVTQGMSQAIKLQYHTHSQGSCPLLYFSSIFQAGGIGR